MVNWQVCAEKVAELVVEELRKCWHGFAWHCGIETEDFSAALTVEAKVEVNGKEHVFSAVKYFDLTKPSVATMALTIGQMAQRQVNAVLVNDDAFEKLLNASVVEWKVE